MLLGIEHLVRQVFLDQQLVDDLGILDGCRAHQHRLAAFVAFTDVGDGRFVFFAGGLVHPIELVAAFAHPVRRNDRGFQPVNFLKLIGFGVGCAGHAGKLFVQPEIILEGDRCHGLVFSLDLYPFLGLHRLVQAIAPAPAGHQAAGEFVDDHDFTILDHIVLVAVIQQVATQGSIQMVHQRNIGRVIQRGAFRNQAQAEQNPLGAFMALLGQKNLARLFVDGEIARLGNALTSARIGFSFLAGQQRHDLVDRQVHLGVVFSLAADDERRACLVNQDRIHLVDDGKIQSALHPVAHLVHHVVAQVVKAKLVVRAVGDVGVVGGLLFFARHVR